MAPPRAAIKHPSYVSRLERVTKRRSPRRPRCTAEESAEEDEEEEEEDDDDDDDDEASV